MLRRTMIAPLIVTAMAFWPALPAPAASARWEPFGTAEWEVHTGHDSIHGLVTSSDVGGTFGGIQLVGGPTDPSEIDAISFDLDPDQTGASGGSPRLVLVFSDGGNAGVRPLVWTADTWTTVDGMTGNNWDNNSGGCGSLYAATYEAIVACHPGATITAIFVVNDSGWLYPPDGETVILDNITVNDSVAGGPGRSA